MYVGLKQPRGDGERYVTPARAAAKETTFSIKSIAYNLFLLQMFHIKLSSAYDILFFPLHGYTFPVSYHQFSRIPSHFSNFWCFPESST